MVTKLRFLIDDTYSHFMAVYAEVFSFSAKPQKHDMVHVEIWLGDKEKTLGARWQTGR